MKVDDFVRMVGISRASYNKILAVGSATERMYKNKFQYLNDCKPKDYNVYDGYMIAVNLAYKKWTVKDLCEKWKDEVSTGELKTIIAQNKNAYHLKVLIEKTFDPMIVPCVIKDGQYISVGDMCHAEETGNEVLHPLPEPEPQKAETPPETEGTAPAGTVETGAPEGEMLKEPEEPAEAMPAPGESPGEDIPAGPEDQVIETEGSEEPAPDELFAQEDPFSF